MAKSNSKNLLLFVEAHLTKIQQITTMIGEPYVASNDDDELAFNVLKNIEQIDKASDLIMCRVDELRLLFVKKEKQNDN